MLTLEAADWAVQDLVNLRETVADIPSAAAEVLMACPDCKPAVNLAHRAIYMMCVLEEIINAVDPHAEYRRDDESQG